MLPLLPDDWLNFAELVVPELQRRGLTRRDMRWALYPRSLLACGERHLVTEAKGSIATGSK